MSAMRICDAGTFISVNEFLCVDSRLSQKYKLSAIWQIQMKLVPS